MWCRLGLAFDMFQVWLGFNVWSAIKFAKCDRHIDNCQFLDYSRLSEFNDWNPLLTRSRVYVIECRSRLICEIDDQLSNKIPFYVTTSSKMAFSAIKKSQPLINGVILRPLQKIVDRVININSSTSTTTWMAMMFLAKWRFFPCLLCIPRILHQAGVLIITLEIETGVLHLGNFVPHDWEGPPIFCSHTNCTNQNLFQWLQEM